MCSLCIFKLSNRIKRSNPKPQPLQIPYAKQLILEVCPTLCGTLGFEDFPCSYGVLHVQLYMLMHIHTVPKIETCRSLLPHKCTAWMHPASIPDLTQ